MSRTGPDSPTGSCKPGYPSNPVGRPTDVAAASRQPGLDQFAVVSVLGTAVAFGVARVGGKVPGIRVVPGESSAREAPLAQACASSVASPMDDRTGISSMPLGNRNLLNIVELTMGARKYA